MYSQQHNLRLVLHFQLLNEKTDFPNKFPTMIQTQGNTKVWILQKQQFYSFHRFELDL